MTEGQRNPADRVNTNPSTTEQEVENVMQHLITKKCLAHEETQLGDKYPEYKSLLREYEEGILLFEVKKQLVWDKASNDEEGLKTFYDNNSDRYKWAERARVSHYTLQTQDAKLVKKVSKKAKKKSPEEVKALFNKDEPIVQVTGATSEKGKNPQIDAMTWKAGTTSEPVIKDGFAYFSKIEEVVPSTEKKLEEARGYVVADYQDHLEKSLIQDLRKSYKVEIDEEAFQSMVKE